MQRILLFIIILSSCLSCLDKKNTKASGLIDLNRIDRVSVNDLFESIELVQLETTDECLIAHATKIIFYNDRYYVFDVRQQAIFCFNSAGKFVFKISNRGQGPEEYLNLEDFNIDSYNRHLLLLVPFGSLVTFDADGKFVSKIRLPEELVAYNEVYPLNKDTLLFTSLNKYAQATYSKRKNSLIKKRLAGINHNVFSPLRKTYTYNDRVFFSPPPSNDIINVSDDTIAFSWNFGNRNNTRKQIENVKKFIESESDSYKRATRNFVLEKRMNYNIMYNYETSRYRICILDYGEPEFRHVFYDKETNQPFVFDKTIEEIQFLIPNFNEESIIVSEQRFKYKIYDDTLLSENQKKIIHSHKEEDNPFLVKYNLKQMK